METLSPKRSTVLKTTKRLKTPLPHLLCGIPLTGYNGVRATGLNITKANCEQRIDGQATEASTMV